MSIVRRVDTTPLDETPARKWKYDFPNPFERDVVEKFVDGLEGYKRCVAVAQALRAGGIIPIPEDELKGALAVAGLLSGFANG
jgi:hypothetical protein